MQHHLNFTYIFKSNYEYIKNVKNSLYFLIERWDNMPFRIHKVESINKTVRMPTDLIGSLERLATQHDISFNQLVVQCCRYALENLDMTEDERSQLRSE